MNPFANMQHHETYVGQEIDAYRQLLLSSEEEKSVDVLDSLWNSVKNTGSRTKKKSHLDMQDL